MVGSGLLGAALSYGLSTLVVQGSAAMAAIRLVSSPSPRSTVSRFGRLHRRVQKWMAASRPLTGPQRAFAAVIGGSAVTVWATWASEPTCTESRLRHTAVWVSLWLSALGVVQGVILVSGLEVMTPPILAGGSVAALGLVAHSRFRRRRQTSPASTSSRRTSADFEVTSLSLPSFE